MPAIPLPTTTSFIFFMMRSKFLVASVQQWSHRHGRCCQALQDARDGDAESSSPHCDRRRNADRRAEPYGRVDGADRSEGIRLWLRDGTLSATSAERPVGKGLV